VLVDVASGAPIRRMTGGHDEFFVTLAFDTVAAWSPDGTMVTTAGRGGTVVLWRVADRAQVRTLAADPQFVSAVAFSPDGTLVAAAGSAERFATLWGRGQRPVDLLRRRHRPGVGRQS
jgi:WD40 repeat protein